MADADLGDEGGGGDEGGDAPWMATFADLSTLLLTFFVLLLSFANMDVVEFKMMLGSVREAMGVQHTHPGRIMGLTTSVVELSKRESTPNLDLLEMEMVQKVKDFVRKKGLEDSIEVKRGERGVVVQVKEQLLFRAGRARLRKKAHQALSVIAELSRQVDLPLWIEGHTDNRPIRTRRFPSNWELSAARAAATLRHLVSEEKVDVKRIRIAGYADTNPIATNDTAEGRKKNRRVEFVFVRPAEKKLSEVKKPEEVQGPKPEVVPPPPKGALNVIDLDLSREHREAQEKRRAATRSTTATATEANPAP